MAIKSKTKMGSMVGMNPTEIVAMPKNTEKEIAVKEKKAKAATSVTKRKEGAEVGRLKFELIEGEEEKNLNVSVPRILYNAIAYEAMKQKMPVKQFVGEILLETMMKKYGFEL